MRTRYYILTFIAVLVLAGCQKTPDSILSFRDTGEAVSYEQNKDLSENDFFAKNLAIIPDNNSWDENAITSSAGLLILQTTNQALYSKNAHERLYPASLTKLVTAMIAFRMGELTDTVTISNNAVRIADSRAKVCGFDEGDQVSLDALISCMLIYAGNDAAIALAEHLAGSEELFVKRMNEEVLNLGAVNTHFVNSHGLHDDDQYTTAYDMYLIFNYLLGYDTFRAIISEASYTVSYKDRNGDDKTKTFQTTNQYLKGDRTAPEGLTVVGGKTGNTRKAGNCLIMLSRDLKENEYISLIMKAGSENNLYQDMADLFSYR